MAWTAVLGTLLGTLLGACGAIASQYVAARAAERRDRVQRRAALRAERLTAIQAFMDAEQDAERVAGDPDQFDYAAKTQVVHALWATHKRLALVCSEELASPLDELANKLNLTIWNGPPNDVPAWKHIQAEVWQFRGAAKREVEWAEEATA